MTLVRGSKNRLMLDWSRQGMAVGSDGTRYLVQREHVRGERPAYYAEVYLLGKGYGLAESERISNECPYGVTVSEAEQKKVCEWVAWDRAGRPSA